MSNNKLYTEEQVFKAIQMADKYHYLITSEECDIVNSLTPIELPSDEEIEEKLEVAFGNGYEQGEMDFYKKMQEKGNEYTDGYAEGYKRALELVKHKIDNDLQGGNNEQQ